MEQYIKSIKIINNIADEEVLSIKTTISKGMMSFSVINANKSYSMHLYEKLKSAFLYNSLKFPYGRVNVNISDRVKETSILDLPISLSILKTQGIINNKEDILIIGEIGIDGSIKEIKNPYRYIRFAIDNKFHKIMMPASVDDFSNYKDSIEIIEIKTLKDAIQYFRIGRSPILNKEKKVEKYNIDLNDVQDQKQLIRALTIAIAGKHNILIKGPIGSGKSISIESIKSILPKLDTEEYLLCNDLSFRYNEMSNYQNNSKLVYPKLNITNKEFFGSDTKMGLISQMNNSYLVLDEVNLYKKNFIESIKIMMDSNDNFKFNRKKYIQYPENFSVIALMNPCPCGNLGTNNKCSCTQAEISRHNKLDKSFLDRFSIKIILHHPKIINNNKNKYEISTIKKAIEKVIDIQKIRYNNKFKNNGNIKIKNIEEYLNFNSKLLGILKDETSKHNYSRRTVENILKVARTIADLDANKHIEFQHLIEAINYQKM